MNNTLKKLYILLIFFNLVWVQLFFAIPSHAAANLVYSPEQTEAVLLELEEKSKQVQSLSCDFVQTKQLAMFDSPIESKGKMFFKRPAALRWEYSSPIESGFFLKAGEGKSWTNAGGEQSSQDLSKSPALKAMSGQIMAWLSINKDFLLKAYSIELEQLEPVIIKLVPKNARVAEYLAFMQVHFSADKLALTKLRLEEKDGDYTVIEFLNTQTNALIADKIFEAK